MKALIDADTSNDEESWLLAQIKRATEETEKWPQWRQDSISEEDQDY